MARACTVGSPGLVSIDDGLLTAASSEEVLKTAMAKNEAGPKKDKADEGDSEESLNAASEWAKSIIIAAVLFIFLRSFLVQTFVITSGSMEETLLVGDMLLVNRAAIGSHIPLTGIRIPGYSMSSYSTLHTKKRSSS